MHPAFWELFLIKTTPLTAAAPRMAKTLQRAAHVLAEIADQLTGDDSSRLSRLRGEIVDTIMAATPGHYGKTKTD